MIKPKIKLKRRNPKTFRDAILETVDRNIAEYKELSKEHYYQAPIILNILKILKQEFSKEELDEYSDARLITELKWIFEDLKKDIHNHTNLD